MTRHERFTDPDAALCIILARGGSKGVPRKNLQKVGGVSLIGRSVRAAKRARAVGRVFVSTDCPDIATEAAQFGAQTLERPASLASDDATSEAGWLHALAQVNNAPDRLVFLQCTSPFITGADIDGCLARMDDADAACALSVVPDHGFLWEEASDGAHGLTHDATLPRLRRQDMTPRYRESGAIYTVRRTDFLERGTRFCGKVALFEVGHPQVEIDTFDDLEVCRAVAKPPDAPVRSVLERIRAVVMDFDGVHTDNRVALDDQGREIVHLSRGDGLGLARLRDAGRWKTLILSKERNPVVSRRAEKLGIDAVQGCDDKHAALRDWCAEMGIAPREVLYIGNDTNDASILGLAGIFACPADSHPSILRAADWILTASGGHGALREMCDHLLDYVSCSA